MLRHLLKTTIDNRVGIKKEPRALRSGFLFCFKFDFVDNPNSSFLIPNS